MSPLYTGMLVLARIAAVVMVAPVTRTVPRPARLAVAATLAIVVTPTVPMLAWPGDFATLAIAVGSEVVVGVLMGMVAAITFGIVEIGVELGAQQIGYGAASQFDPLLQVQASPLGTVAGLLAAGVFLGSDLHLALLVGVGRSLVDVPPGMLAHPFAPGAILVSTVGNVLEGGLAIATPLVGLALLLQGCFAAVMRIVPSINVFFSSGYPILLILGTLLLLVDLPSILEVGLVHMTNAVAIAPTIARMAAP